MSCHLCWEKHKGGVSQKCSESRKGQIHASMWIRTRWTVQQCIIPFVNLQLNHPLGLTLSTPSLVYTLYTQPYKYHFFKGCEYHRKIEDGKSEHVNFPAHFLYFPDFQSWMSPGILTGPARSLWTQNPRGGASCCKCWSEPGSGALSEEA